MNCKSIIYFLLALPKCPFPIQLVFDFEYKLPIYFYERIEKAQLKVISCRYRTFYPEYELVLICATFKICSEKGFIELPFNFYFHNK